MKKSDRILPWCVVVLLLSNAAMAVIANINRIERDTLRARLAHYQEVTHTTPPLCVEGDVRP